MKAVLLSALVLPGSGHFVFKRYSRGVFLSVAALSSMYIIAMSVIAHAVTAAEQLSSGGAPFDFVSVAALLSGETGGGSSMASMATTVFLMAWAFSMLDSYRISKREAAKSK